MLNTGARKWLYILHSHVYSYDTKELIKQSTTGGGGHAKQRDGGACDGLSYSGRGGYQASLERDACP